VGDLCPILLYAPLLISYLFDLFGAFSLVALARTDQIRPNRYLTLRSH
jgi:hypothetical protein